jgi:hypothetical protein
MEIDVPVTRRAPPPERPAFRCSICERSISPSPWPYDADQKPPVCTGCTRHWGAGYGWNAQGGTRGDRIVMQRLSAVTQALKWEIMNGRRAH